MNLPPIEQQNAGITDATVQGRNAKVMSGHQEPETHFNFLQEYIDIYYCRDLTLGKFC